MKANKKPHSGPTMLAFALSIILILSCGHVLAAAPSQGWTGKVVKVVDGDTIVVMRRGKPVKIRLWGIDCPESPQPFGNQATRFTERLLGKTVKIDPKDIDRYRRVVARVIDENGRDHGLELIKAGWAWWYKKYAPRAKEYKAAQAKARVENRGLWRAPDPIPPWRWRSKSKRNSRELRSRLTYHAALSSAGR